MVFTRFLHGVHGFVGAMHQGFHVPGVFGEERNANRPTD